MLGYVHLKEEEFQESEAELELAARLEPVGHSSIAPGWHFSTVAGTERPEMFSNARSSRDREM